ncbi:Mss4-like protein [Xylariomycetidae sp. FL2044]|nr:Mss4-like protein [Xylariomycetidae sp. FL2044]
MATPAPLTPRTGSCMCGAIKVRITGTPLRTNLCHCNTCQKSCGGEFAELSAWKAEDVEYTFSDPSVFQVYDDKSPESGSVLQRSFCGTCGSRVKIAKVANPEALVIPVGIIDGDKSDLKPSMEFWCKRRPGWLGDIDGATKFHELPPTPAK